MVVFVVSCNDIWDGNDIDVWTVKGVFRNESDAEDYERELMSREYVSSVIIDSFEVK